jgi:hypothetical protein
MVFWLIWLLFTGYAFLLAPPDSPETWQLIINLSTGQWTGINPLTIALFNLMGLWPMIYAAVMLFDGSDQKFKPGFFNAASFAVGAFAILPYLGLRQPSENVTVMATPLLKFLDNRWLVVAIGLGAIGLLSYGFTQGNWPDFVHSWLTQRFIHVMSLDFLMLSSLFPILAKEDLSRRGGEPWLWWLSFLPLVGAIVYLYLRPRQIFANAEPISS